MVTQPQLQPESTWQIIIRLLRWDKPAGRLILMIPALWAVFLSAGGQPPLPLVGVIILGSLATSAAGCVINDLWDRDIDPLVERTSKRPLAEKSLQIKTAIVVAVIAFASAGIFAFYLNWFSFFLCVAAIPVIICYPLAKRVFPVPQLVLAIAWGFAVLISWSAVTGTLTTDAWLLWGATVLWTLGFDTIYAMSDREDDLSLGINSSAIFFGKYVVDAVGSFFAGTVGLLACLGVSLDLGFGFWVAWTLAVGGWIIQYVVLGQRNLEQEIYGSLFTQNVWIGFILLLGMIVGS